MERKCENCDHFEEFSETEGGWCRRYPPSSLIIEWDNPADRTRFPRVYKDERCGEFSPRIAPPRLIGIKVE